jgi:spermidine/putrescine transport system permease protein
MAGAWKWLKEHLLLIFAGAVALYMLIPIAVIALFSFGETPKGRLTFSFDGFTTEYWGSAFSNPALNDALLTSVQLAAVSTLVSTALGTLMAVGLVGYRFAGQRVTNLLIVLPMATPELVVGAALLSMFIAYSAPLGFGTLLVAHIMFSISFVVVVVRSRLVGFDRYLEDAAADLGAGPVATFRTVTLPLLLPAVGGAGFLAFVLSLDDFVISNFNSGTTVTFPLYVFGAVRTGIPVEVNVLATIMFALTALGAGLVLWQQKRAERMATRRDEVRSGSLMPGAEYAVDPLLPSQVGRS